MILQILIQRLIRPHGKDSFIYKLPYKSKLFDIGCGNNSPQRVKISRGDIFYIGLDIQDYSQSLSSIKFADEYRLVEPDAFMAAINKEENNIDAVISSHNLEHCNDPMNVLNSMCKSLKIGGLIYISFPCEKSVHFPSRGGTLNFYDDKSHKLPISYSLILNYLELNGFEIVFQAKEYRPFFANFIGGILEPISIISKKVLPFGLTWAFWGFESIIWAKKLR